MSVRAGILLAEARERADLTQMELAVAAGLSHSIIQKVEAGKPVTHRTIAKILRAIGDKGGVAESEIKSLILPRPKRSAQALDNNVTRAPENPPPIPEWSAEIACGHWVECSTAELDQRSQMEIIARGMFIVRCTGDSMLPTYKSGARVLFRIVRLDEEALRIGADYYWQNSDGQCTLKRLKAIEEDEYVLAPLNKKYKPLRVAKQLISRVAIVETLMHAPWNGDD